jgi:acetyltransferase-like isoleucine patch superfamily enzyme
MSTISKHAVIHPNVILGNNITVEEFCIIGCPFKGYKSEPTIIGDNAIIRSGSVIYAGNKIGKNFQTGNKVNIRELNNIGNDVSIGTLTVIEHHVLIEDGVRIHSQVFVPEYSKLMAESWIGPNVVLTNAKYPRSPNVKEELLGPHIGVNAKVGANSTILPGIVIGDNSLVGAGSLVSKNVDSDTVVAGHPAKFIRKIDY